MIKSHGISDVGTVRQENQDRILMDQDLALYIVADGMGGHRHGEMAAELAIETIRYYVDSSRDRFDVSWPFGYNFELSIDANRISTAIRLANRQVWRHAEQGPQFAGMGTTVAAVLVGDSATGAKSAVIANVGDSRAYLYRGGTLKQVTVDDTWLGSFVAKGLITSEDLLNHPMRNVLTQAAGSQEDVEVHVRDHELQDSDMFLLSSDGLHGVLGDEGMRAILAAESDLEQAATRLVASAKEKGAPDNVSVVLLRYIG